MWTKVAIAVALIVISIAAVRLHGADIREIGRSDPKRAAHYRLPWFNFSETYIDGTVLGVAVNSTKLDAIHAAEKAGFTVEPSGWGDNRAGGASLYDRSNLFAIMLRQPYLCFFKSSDLREGMVVDFRSDHVTSVKVHYINSEGP